MRGRNLQGKKKKSTQFTKTGKTRPNEGTKLKGRIVATTKKSTQYTKTGETKLDEGEETCKAINNKAIYTAMYVLCGVILAGVSWTNQHNR